jgi:hypothetical protein
LIIKNLNTKINNKKVTHFSHDFPFSMLPEPVWLKLNVRECKCILIAYLIIVLFKKVNLFSENEKKKSMNLFYDLYGFLGSFFETKIIKLVISGLRHFSGSHL